MNLGAIVTIASGIAAVYVILALITSHFAEAVSSLVGKRGNDLYAGLRQLLGQIESGGAKSDVAELLYRHPLVDGLGTSDRKPSYVPTRNLSLALVSVLHDAALPSDVADATALPPKLLADLLASVNALQGTSDVAKSLVVVLQSANTDYHAALKAIDGWFNAQMDRISGAYKRWSFAVQLVIALVVVVALDADTFAIVAQLSKDAALSTALSSVATSAASSPGVGSQLDALSSNGLQLGWPAWPATPPDATAIVRKISGLLVTWAAALLGAPFWFDLLKAFAPLRLSGTKPADPKATSPDAQSK